MKYLTLMIIPYPGADVRSIRIRHRTIKLVTLFTIVLVGVSIATVLNLKPVLEKAKKYDQLLAENQVLKVENKKINALAQKMESIDDLVNKIQLVQGVKKSTAVNGSESEKDKDANFLFLDNFAGGERALIPPVAPTVDSSMDSTVPLGLPIIEKSYISRSFNPKIFHFGIDLPLKQGTPVRATADGIVTSAEKDHDLGLYLMIKHASGYSTLYAHNNLLTVDKGDRVKKGDLIAYSGNTGQSSGPHLHYAIFDHKGNPIDPLPFLEH
ncbi:MAG TPA: M23 family metallopeptidase [archaeon]|nr:M23 family metallopeptidase [archaeon]